MLSAVRDSGAETGGKVIILTDATNATYDAVTNIKSLVSKGIEILCIGVGDVTQVGWLKDVVSKPPESHYMHVQNHGLLNSLLPILVNIVCNQSPKTNPYTWNQSGQFSAIQIIS